MLLSFLLALLVFAAVPPTPALRRLLGRYNLRGKCTPVVQYSTQYVTIYLYGHNMQTVQVVVFEWTGPAKAAKKKAMLADL